MMTAPGLRRGESHGVSHFQKGGAAGGALEMNYSNPIGRSYDNFVA